MREKGYDSNTFRTVVCVILLTTKLSAVVLASGSEGGSKFCPKICSCDVIEDLKRADCRYVRAENISLCI